MVLLEVEGTRKKDVKGKKIKKKGKDPVTPGEEDIRDVHVKTESSRKEQGSESKETDDIKQNEQGKANLRNEDVKLKSMLRNLDKEKEVTAKEAKMEVVEIYVEVERGAEVEVGRDSKASDLRKSINKKDGELKNLEERFTTLVTAANSRQEEVKVLKEVREEREHLLKEHRWRSI